MSPGRAAAGPWEGPADGKNIGLDVPPQSTRLGVVDDRAPGRVPPHNLDAEASLLGAMLLSSDAISAAIQIVTVDDFYKPAHAHVFDAITKLNAQGKPADPITVAEELKRAGRLDSVGGAGALVDLESQTPATSNAAYYAEIVEELAMMRKLIGVGAGVTQLGYDEPDDVGEAVRSALTLVGALDNPRHSDDPDFFIDWPSFWALPTNAEWLIDNALARGRGHSLFGGRKDGKSLFVLWLCTVLAFMEKIRVLVFDFEMSLEDVSERLTDMGHGPDSDLSRLRYASMPDLPALDTAEGGSRIEAIIRSEQAQAPDAHLVVVFDTYGRVVAGDENDADTVRAFYRHTGTRLKRLGVTWVRVDHTGKDATKGQRGSSAKADDVDIVWQLRPTDDGIELIRKHARPAWVPARVLFHREDDPVLRFVQVAQAWPAGTAEIASALDELKVPMDATATAAVNALRAVGQGRRRDVVLAALRYRRESTS